MVGRRGDKFTDRVTIKDLARMYDTKMWGKSPRYRYQGEALTEHRGVNRGFTVNQADTRLDRMKARASGIRYALENNQVKEGKVKEMEQILKNLELAIRGMELTIKDG